MARRARGARAAHNAHAHARTSTVQYSIYSSRGITGLKKKKLTSLSYCLGFPILLVLKCAKVSEPGDRLASCVIVSGFRAMYNNDIS